MQHKSSPMQWTQCYIQILYPRPMQGKKKDFSEISKTTTWAYCSLYLSWWFC